jgi:hypothetical protein
MHFNRPSHLKCVVDIIRCILIKCRKSTDVFTCRLALATRGKSYLHHRLWRRRRLRDQMTLLSSELAVIVELVFVDNLSETYDPVIT